MPRQKKTPPNRADQRWEVKITVGKTMGGKLIRKSFYSTVSLEDAREQAENYKINQKVRAITGEPIVKRAVTFGEWARTWLEKYKKGTVRESTSLETYERTIALYLLPRFGNTKLIDIRPVDVKDFFDDMTDKYSKTTLDKIRLCLNGIFETAIFNDLCYKNPAKFIKTVTTISPTQKRTYTESERNCIYNYSNAHPCGLSIMILLEQGLRCGEMLGLRWSDFNLNNNTISISRSVACVDYKPVVGECKNKSSVRVNPISTVLAKKNYELRPEQDDYIFKNSRGNLYTVTNYSSIVYKRFFKDLQKEYPDIKKYTPHELRHTCGTLLYNKTNDIYAVSKFLGHSDINITTKLYVHSSPDILRKNLGF